MICPAEVECWLLWVLLGQWTRVGVNCYAFQRCYTKTRGQQELAGWFQSVMPQLPSAFGHCCPCRVAQLCYCDKRHQPTDFPSNEYLLKAQELLRDVDPSVWWVGWLVGLVGWLTVFATRVAHSSVLQHSKAFTKAYLKHGKSHETTTATDSTTMPRN